MSRFHGGISDNLCDDCGKSTVDDLGWYSCTCSQDKPIERKCRRCGHKEWWQTQGCSTHEVPADRVHDWV